MSRPEITVQICSHNRIELLEKVLLSLADQTLPPDQFELVLCANACTDGTAERVRGLDLPYAVTLLELPDKPLAQGRNHGILAAKGWVVLFIDDDVIADRRLLAEHLRSHFAHPRSVVNGWVNHVEEPARPERPSFRMADISTSYFWTSNVSAKREHLMACGLFDTDFQEYGWEDQEIGFRLRALGITARYNYRAIGYHVKRPPAATDVRGMLRQAEAKGRTAVLYVHKHPELRTRLATGIHPPRLAVHRMANLGGFLERFCRRQLGLDQERPEPERLNPLQRWCATQLSTIHYFRSIAESHGERVLGS